MREIVVAEGFAKSLWRPGIRKQERISFQGALDNHNNALSRFMFLLSVIMGILQYVALI